MGIVGPPDAARLPAYAGTAGAQVCRALNPQEHAAYGQMLQRGDERLARWHAPPKLEAVRSAMKRVAASSGAFYWDWAKYMGGPCSIHAWTAFKPPLAAPDHVTLTEAGEERSARAFFAELMAGFEAHQRQLAAKAQAASDVASRQVSPRRSPPKSARKSRSRPVRLIDPGARPGRHFGCRFDAVRGGVSRSRSLCELYEVAGGADHRPCLASFFHAPRAAPPAPASGRFNVRGL